MAKEKSGINPRSVELSTAQVAKLQALAQPDRWVDETFAATAIGAFLLKAELILVNPEQDSHKAYILTELGKQVLRAMKQPRVGSKNPTA
jgi:hypothetical protein